MALVVTILAGCASERVPDVFGPTDAYVAYVASLARMEVDDTELGSAWIEAGAEALAEPREVTVPYDSSGYIDPEQPDALGLEFSLGGGEAVRIHADLQGTPETLTFLDVFRLSEDGPVPVASAGQDSLEVRFAARRGGTYVARFQPELLRGGEYSLRLETIEPARVRPTPPATAAIGP